MTISAIPCSDQAQARTNVNTIRLIVQKYSAVHPKKHGLLTLLFLLLPTVLSFIPGYIFMKGGSLAAGAMTTLIISIPLYSCLGRAGCYRPVWKDDGISHYDMDRVRDFSPSIKNMLSEHMENNDGVLTYSQLEAFIPMAERWLMENDVRLNIQKQLGPDGRLQANPNS